MTLRSLIVLGCALSLAACQTNASNCAGWKRVELKAGSALYLAQNDPAAGGTIAGNNRFGKAQGCWK